MTRKQLFELQRLIATLRSLKHYFKGGNSITETIKRRVFDALKELVGLVELVRKVPEYTKGKLLSDVYYIARRENLHNAPFITALSVMVLAYTDCDHKLTTLLRRPAIIADLISCFTSNRELCIRSVSKESLLKALSVVASDDDNSSILAKSEILNCVLDIAEDNSNPGERYSALRLITAFTLTRNLKRMLTDNQRVSDLITHQAKSTKYSFPIGFFLKDSVQPWLSRARRNLFVKRSGRVMISYSHKFVKVAEKIRTKLNTSGIGTWLDQDNIGLNLIDDMAAGVEDAKVVLVLMSRSYSHSINCKMEALYAREMGKILIPVLAESGYTPTGWLGLLFPSLLAMRFKVLGHETNRDETEVMKLIAEVKSKLVSLSPLPFHQSSQDTFDSSD